MHDSLRTLIGNTAESFRTKGREFLAAGDVASAGAAFTVEHWLTHFVPMDRAQQTSMPEPAAPAKKRDRKPKQTLLGASEPKTDPPPPPKSEPRLSNGGEAHADD